MVSRFMQKPARRRLRRSTGFVLVAVAVASVAVVPPPRRAGTGDALLYCELVG